MSAHDDISAYLLGELSPEESAAFELALAGDPSLRAQLDALRPVAARLEGLDARAWDPPAAPALRMPEPPRRRRLLVLRPAVAAVAAVALLLAGLAVGLLTQREPGGREIALEPLGTATPGPKGEAELGSERATVHVDGLPASARGQYYELWLLNSPDDLVSLGSFRVPKSGAADVTVPVPGDSSGYSYVDLSVEADDGNPAHSGKSVLRGRVPDA